MTAPFPLDLMLDAPALTLAFDASSQEAIWVGALTAAPVALAVAALCRGVSRPGTRHALWCLALLAFVLPGVLVGTGLSTRIAGLIERAPGVLARAFPPERAAQFVIDGASDGAIESGPAVRGGLAEIPIVLGSGELGSEESPIAGAPGIQSADRAPRSLVEAAPVAPSPARALEFGDPPASPRAEGPASERPVNETPRGTFGSDLVATPSTLGRPAPVQVASNAGALTRSHTPTLSARHAESATLPHPRSALSQGVPASTTHDAGVADRREATRRAAAEHSRIDAGTEMPAAAPVTSPIAPPAHRAEPRAPKPAPAPVLTDPIWNALNTGVATTQRWLDALAAAARELLSIPAPPAWLWIAGVLAILAVGVGRSVTAARALRRLTPVARSDQRLVRDIAEKLGLAHTPRAYTVAARVSPMVCGWLTPRVILPESLWRHLDLDARRAVLTHELAHLRRRDQWVRLGEIVVGVLYWWHPVLWAVRRRLREEADLCCDAWVTTLFPRLRRSYAEALLRTRVYLSTSGTVAPVAGLGMASARSRRFSRRLTMVMTGRTRPMASPVGLALALVVGTAAVVVGPSLAHAALSKKAPCPPEQTAAVSSGSGTAGTLTPAAPVTGVVSTPRASSGGGGSGVAAPTARVTGVVTTPRATSGGGVSGVVSAAPAASCCTDETPAGVAAGMSPAAIPLVGSFTSTGRGVAGAPSQLAGVQSGGFGSTAPSVATGLRQVAPQNQAELEARVRVLEAQIEALQAALEELTGQPAPSRARFGPASGTLDPISFPMQDSPFTGEGRAKQDPFFSGDAAAALTSFAISQPTPDAAQQAWVSYSLPDGKAEALWELMRRSDVPIYVRQNGSGIDLQGTPAQQRVFSQFLSLIHPEGRYADVVFSTAEMPPEEAVRHQAQLERLRALEAARAGTTDAMRARADIERAYALQAEQAARVAAQSAAVADRERAMEAETVARARALAREQADRAQVMARDQAARAQAEAVRQQARAIEAQRREVEAQVGRQIEQGRRQIEAARRQHEQQARDLQAEAGRLEQMAVEVEHRRSQVEAQRERAENRRQQRELEAQIDALEAEAEALRERAEHVREQAEHLHEQLAEMVEHLTEREAEMREHLERAMAELHAHAMQAGGRAMDCACDENCTGEGCEDDCDPDCCCRTREPARETTPEPIRD
ncbi:MAG: M56 family metallopeptidase [Phycisphaerales bacterium]